ncbi:MAG: hypothetical protein JWN70_4615 [Planctomycetaceae bacterium]|nr:hypothetical protein [Planctomycetaceae bacterium]
MQSLRGLIFVLILCIGSQHTVLADDAALIEGVFRTHAEAVARAETLHKRAIDKARDDAVSQLLKMTVKAYKANSRVAETAAWKAILRIDRTHKKAIQYFTDLGNLDKVLEELPDPEHPMETAGAKPTANPKPAEVEDLTGPSLQKWMMEVAALPADLQTAAVMQKLMLVNPQFDGKFTHEITAGSVTTLALSSDKLINLAPLRALSRLTVLVCPATAPTASQLEDLSPLKDLPLTRLNIRNTQVQDLKPLSGMRLNSLDCAFMPVSDLSPLKGAPLVSLECQSTQVETLTALKGMKLDSLNCSYNKIVDLSPLRGMSLLSLYMIETEVEDLSPLKGMRLIVLSMTRCPVSDLNPVAGMPITSIAVDGTRVTDLAPLRGIAIEHLSCQDTKIAQLTPLKGMPLKRLHCDLKQDSDIPILRGIKSLETINDIPVAQFWTERGKTKVPGTK